MINPRKEKRKYRYFVADFETTVYKGQVHTEVWAAAIVELFTEDVHIFHSIGDLWEYMVSLDCNICCYFHNLKFDGSFWLPFFLNDLHYQQAFKKLSDNELDLEAIETKDMHNKSFKYVISDMGQWYTITAKTHDHIFEIRDSLKLLPFSVKRIGESFGTKHKKLEMEYKGFRYAGCTITDEEKEYIANDVLVVKEALEIMINQGHDKLTIGSCCLSEYRDIYGTQEYQKDFPDLEKIPLDFEKFGSTNADAYIRKSYKGGWCYLVPGKSKQILYNGTTADVNSLYPSMMSSESGNYYPYGSPTFWSGNYLPIACKMQDIYYFIRIKVRFQIKPKHLPCIQIKNNFLYRANEWLTTSDIYDKKSNTYYRYYDDNGERKDSTVILTLTCIDYKLIQEQYDLYDLEILDGCFFKAKRALFDDYMEKYKKIKLESKGALRELAKLFLNNLYGKFASSSNSSWKYAYLKEDKSIGFDTIEAHNKKVGYIAIGSAITSYSRNFTIRAAQANYYGSDKRGFVYADTDSIHCDLKPEELKGIKVHDKNFCCWKLESQWDTGWFTRQKTYIEHVTGENLEPIEKPYYNIKCAGMPDKCKNLLIMSMQGIEPTVDDKLTEEEINFVHKKRTYEDFDVGLKIPGKLLPKRIEGGIILTDTYYTML